MPIRLTWTPNAESDMYKYNIYRQSISTGEIEKIDEVLHPTNEYIDPDGSSAYIYFISAVDTSGNESEFSTPVRLPENSSCCIIYDFLYSAKNQPVKNAKIKISIVSLPYDYAGRLWSGQQIEITTDQNGYFEIELPKKATIKVEVAEFGINATISVPDTGMQRLADLL